MTQDEANALAVKEFGIRSTVRLVPASEGSPTDKFIVTDRVGNQFVGVSWDDALQAAGADARILDELTPVDITETIAESVALAAVIAVDQAADAVNVKGVSK